MSCFVALLFFLFLVSGFECFGCFVLWFSFGVGVLCVTFVCCLLAGAGLWLL